MDGFEAFGDGIIKVGNTLHDDARNLVSGVGNLFTHSTDQFLQMIEDMMKMMIIPIGAVIGIMAIQEIRKK